jgi:hypothetical protein
VRDEFLQNAVILKEDTRAFAGTPLEAQLEMFPRFAANVAALDRFLGPLTAPSTAADAEHAAERRHQELMEEVRRGQRDLADLLLEHMHRLLARALRPLTVTVPCVAPVPSAPAHAVDNGEEEEEDNDEEDEE